MIIASIGSFVATESDTFWVMLTFKCGLAAAWSAWRLALALTYGWFSTAIGKAVELMIPEDHQWFVTLFNRRSYRLFIIFFRVLTSVQLPGAATKPCGNTDRFVKQTTP